MLRSLPIINNLWFTIFPFLILIGCGGGGAAGGSEGNNGSPGSGGGASAQAIAATRVYGQVGSFITGTANSDGVTADSLSSPRAAAADAGGVYVTDAGNNRVLYFLGTSTTPSRVYGQAGSFTSNQANKGGISADSLSMPQGVAVDAGGVYIVDAGNYRVLYFANTSTTANRVYGQGGSFTSATFNNGGISADSLGSASAVAIDVGGIYIADDGNQRVLYFSGTSTTATRVYGQSGSFTTSTINKGGRSADSLYYPTGVAADATGVYISDYFNNRVLYYAGTSTTATRVYGQSNFTNGTSSTSDTTLSFPQDIAIDASGVYIADNGNNRVLYYSGTSTTATRVYGQIGLYSNSVNVGTNGLGFVNAVALTASGVYIVDGQNRVLYYTGTSTTASRVYGQYGSYTTKEANSGRADGLNTPQSVSGDVSGIYVADTYNHRVLYYAGTSTTATRVYGQGGSFTANTRNNGGISADSLANPSIVVVDTSGVYIADNGNSRVLFYPTTSTTATRVYGQAGNFTTANATGISATTLWGASGIALDSGGVYISDSANNRILYFAGTSTTASRVYGQAGSFTTNTANNGGRSSNSLFSPQSIALDTTGLYVVDYANYRVLYFNGTSTTASRVYGQQNNFTTANMSPAPQADTLFGAAGVTTDTTGVYIADTGVSRILYFTGTSTTASKVWGHADFTSNAPNDGGLSARSLKTPQSMWAGNGGLFAVDTGNHRVLFYPN